MSFPSNWKQVPLTGTYLGYDATPPRGQVIFQSAQILIGAALVMAPQSLAFVLDASGHFSGMIPATNDPNYAPQGFPYLVIEDFPGGRAPFYAYIDHLSDGYDMSTLVPVVAPPQLDPAGPIGPNGNTLFATFDVDPATGDLIVTTPNGYFGPTFDIDAQGYIEVNIG